MNSTRSQDSYDGFNALLVNVISAVYGIISLGFFSNVAVAIVVGNILVRLGRHLPNRHMLVYVLALCIVDALVLGTLPMLITQIYLQRWIFGQTLCTVYWTIESINKTLSTFILTCLSFDRYLAVRFPQRCLHIRTVRGAMYILFSCIIFAALLLMPVYLHAEIFYVPIASESNGTETVVATCAFVGKTSFLFTIFTLCYVVPFACMTCFYGSMLARLRHKSRKLGLRQGRVRRVTKKTLTLVILYFTFWTPYWIMTMASVISDAMNKSMNDSKINNGSGIDQQRTNTTSMIFPLIVNQTETSDNSQTSAEQALSAITFAIMCVIHSGCYLNSAINPILYALLNRELRRQHYAAMNNAARNSIPNGANANGHPAYERAARGSLVSAMNGAPMPQQRLPLILCTSVDGVRQVRWEEAASDISSLRTVTPQISIAVVRMDSKKGLAWTFWRKSKRRRQERVTRGESTTPNATLSTGAMYSRLISISTANGDRSQAIPDSNSAKRYSLDTGTPRML